LIPSSNIGLNENENENKNLQLESIGLCDIHLLSVLDTRIQIAFELMAAAFPSR
jgi:hypothetical protein